MLVFSESFEERSKEIKEVFGKSWKKSTEIFETMVHCSLHNATTPSCTFGEYAEIVEALGGATFKIQFHPSGDIVTYIIGKLPMTVSPGYQFNNRDVHYRLFMVKKDILMLHKAIQIDEPVYIGKLNTQ